MQPPYTAAAKTAAPRIGLLQFPGSNCDDDCREAMRRLFGIELQAVWHSANELPPGLAGLIIPGGFSFGDYLRAGHLASHSPIMRQVVAFAQQGGAILGICNGFQILTEAGLLPGTLRPNEHRQFVCRYVRLQGRPGLSTYQQTTAHEHLQLPIAHGQGCYYIDPAGLERLHGEGQVAYVYADDNPNGSTAAIAGVCSRNGRILGLMPHPERATEALCGGSGDGRKVLEAFLAACL